MPGSPRRRRDQVLRGQRWLVLLASVAVAGCASGVRVAATTGSPPLRQLLVVGSTSRFYDPCQGSFFVSECGSAVGSAGVAFNSPTVQEFILQYRSAAAAAGAEQSQQTTELSAGWLCSVPSQCPVTPVDVGPVGPPVYAVTFTIGARGNLSETTRLAAVTKGPYLVNLSWISASTVSASRVTPPGAARALLKEALGKIPA
jgi:hypothetical protein